VLARFSDDATEELSLLSQKLGTKKNIVLITGAGISTNAGSKFV
jgi:NAD-dependent SIR2 family protein deacetylase